MYDRGIIVHIKYVEYFFVANEILCPPEIVC